MEKMMSCKEAADLWNFTERWVSILCKGGKIEGAVKQGHKWFIPITAKKPADGRIKTGAYRKEGGRQELPLPLGISSYRKAVSDYYYVDKTLFLKDFLDEKPKVSLFLRPPKFGKTLLLDMVRTFFEKTGEDTSPLFNSRKIWGCGEYYRRHQGAYPVIWLSFKDLRFETWAQTRQQITLLFQYELSRHQELAGSEMLNEFEQGLYRQLTMGQADEVMLASALFYLCHMLHQIHGVPPILLVDDVDVPFLHSQAGGYGRECGAFLARAFSTVLKDNPHISFAIFCGARPLPSSFAESILPGAKTYTVSGNSFADCFGFTSEEAEAMAAYLNMENRLEDLEEWYGGYHFGREVLFQPYSLVHSLTGEGRPAPGWTADTEPGGLFGPLFQAACRGNYLPLSTLLQGGSVKLPINLLTPGQDQEGSPSSLYGRLVQEGFLSVSLPTYHENGSQVFHALIPNSECMAVWRREFISYLCEVGLLLKGGCETLKESIFARDSSQFRLGLKTLFPSRRPDSLPEDSEQAALILADALRILSNQNYSITLGSRRGDQQELRLTPEITTLPTVTVVLSSGLVTKLIYDSTRI